MRIYNMIHSIPGVVSVSSFGTISNLITAHAELRPRSSSLAVRSTVGDQSNFSTGLKSSPAKVLHTTKETVVRGVDLSRLNSKTERLSLSVERCGYSEYFGNALPDQIVNIEVLVTSDYLVSEDWCMMISKQKPKFFGMSLYHLYITEPPPRPSLSFKPKRRFRQENSPEGPPPLPPGGPLLLNQESGVISMMVLAVEKKILLLRLCQMEVVGPQLRELMESPFLLKCGRHLTEFRKSLRQDGIQVIGVHDIQEFFLRSLKANATRRKTRRIIRKAGFQTFMQSVTGVSLSKQYIPPYLWGEEELSNELILNAALEAWSCWALVKTLESLDSQNIPVVTGISS